VQPLIGRPVVQSQPSTEHYVNTHIYACVAPPLKSFIVDSPGGGVPRDQSQPISAIDCLLPIATCSRRRDKTKYSTLQRSPLDLRVPTNHFRLSLWRHKMSAVYANRWRTIAVRSLTRKTALISWRVPSVIRSKGLECFTKQVGERWTHPR